MQRITLFKCYQSLLLIFGVREDLDLLFAVFFQVLVHCEYLVICRLFSKGILQIMNFNEYYYFLIGLMRQYL